MGTIVNPKYLKLITEALQSALDELPSYSNQVIFRNEDYHIESNENVISWFETRIGSRVEFPFFISCSKEKFSNKNLYYKITTCKNSYARDLMPLLMILEPPKAESEKEVMIKLGAHFIVKGTNKKNEIYLEECEQNNEDAIMLRYNFWVQNDGRNEVNRPPLTPVERRHMQKQIAQANIE